MRVGGGGKTAIGGFKSGDSLVFGIARALVVCGVVRLGFDVSYGLEVRGNGRPKCAQISRDGPKSGGRPKGSFLRDF